MIDREQVLHVAKLARLRLSDDEVERMTGELSQILEHVEQIRLTLAAPFAGARLCGGGRGGARCAG